MKQCARCCCEIELSVLCRSCRDYEVFRPDGPEESFVFVNEAFLEAFRKERDKTQDARERIKRLINAAMVDNGLEGLGGNYQSVDECLLVELVAKECISLVQEDIVRNGDTRENRRTYKHVSKLREYFGVDTDKLM